MKCSMPASLASSTTYWIKGLSTMVSISFGIALVAGRTRVPRPATGKTALRIFMGAFGELEGNAGLVGSRFFGRRQRPLDSPDAPSPLLLIYWKPGTGLLKA